MIGSPVDFVRAFLLSHSPSLDCMAGAASSDSSVMRYVTGGMASMGAVVVSNPVEVCEPSVIMTFVNIATQVVKTRMQLQGELKASGTYSRPYRNIFHAFLVIARNEGVRGLQKGLSTALGYQAVMNGTRLCLYDITRNKVYQLHGRAPSYLETVAIGSFNASSSSSTLHCHC